MFRRASISGFALVVAGLFVVFLPLASASAGTRAHHTMVVTSLFAAMAVVAGTWLVLARQGVVRSGYLAVAALAGSLSVALFAGAIPDLAQLDRSVLVARLLGGGLLNGLGVWLFVIGLRRALPRPNRALAATAIILVVVGLLLWPSLLLQPGTEARHHLSDVQPQLRAGFRYWTVGAILLVGPFLALMTLPGDWFERWWSQAATRVMGLSSRSFQWLIAAAALALTIAISIYSFDRRATTADEIAQLWHARMLLHGELAMPPDPNPEFFAIDNVIDRPRWMSQFPIGGPAVLSLGLAVGAAWLLNPLLTVLLILSAYRFARRAYGEPDARAAAALLALSPMVLIMGATHMNHTPTALLVMLAFAALSAWIGDARDAVIWRSAAIIGLVLGVALTIRPLDAVIGGVVIGMPMLAAAWRDRVRARSLLGAIAAAVPPVLLLLFVNWRTNGSPVRFGYEVLWGENHSLGLHDDPTGIAHTPWRALLLVVKYAAQTNWISTAWPVPVLLVVAIGLTTARRPHRWDVLLLAFFVAQLVTYGFYWHDGQFVGPRFLFSAIPALLILAARAPFLVTARVQSRTIRRIALILIPVCIGVAWFRSMRPYGVQALVTEFRESRSRLKIDPPREIRDGSLRNVLVFVQEGASTRLLRRLWGLGVSRPDAARLLSVADGCSLADVVRREESVVGPDSTGRLERIERSLRAFTASPANLRVPDYNFRITDSTSLNDACRREIAHDYRVENTIGYGGMLLENRFGDDNRIGGDVVYVMDLGDHNEVLRARFGDRRWFRFELPRNARENRPILVPYDTAR